MIENTILGPWMPGYDSRRAFSLREKLLDRRGGIDSIDVGRAISIPMASRGVETHLYPWRKSVNDDGGRGVMSHWRPVFPAVSAFASAPGPVVTSTTFGAGVPPAPPTSAFLALEDARQTAAMEPRIDVEPALGLSIPAGWPCLIVRGVHDHDERLIAFGAGGPIVAQHRGNDLHRFSSRVYDIAGVALGRNAGLHSAFRVDPDLRNRDALAWNLTPSEGDGTGEGFVAGIGALGATETAVPGGSGRLTLALGAWQRGGPFHVGAIADKHRIAVNRDGVPINPLHLDIDALFFDDDEKDGGLDYEREPWMTGADYQYISKVHFRWNPFRSRFGWFSSSLFSEPRRTPPPTDDPPPPTDVPPPDDPPTKIPPTDTPNDKPPKKPRPRVGDPFGVEDPSPEKDFDDGTDEPVFGVVPGKRRRRPGRGGGKGKGGGDGRGGPNDNEFNDRLKDLDAKDEADRRAKRDAEKKRREQEERGKGKGKPRDEKDLTPKEKQELERLNAILEGLRADYNAGRLSLEQYLRLFQYYNGLRKKLLTGGLSNEQQYQIELEALKALVRAGKITTQEYADRVRELQNKYFGASRKPNQPDIDRRRRNPSNQFTPSLSASAIAVPDLFQTVTDANGAVETGGRYGQNFRTRYVAPFGGHWQMAANSAGGAWPTVTTPGQILGRATVDSIAWMLPPERSIEEPEQDPIGTAGGSSCVGVGVHGGKGVIGLGVPSRNSTAPAAIWDGAVLKLSGASGARALNINPINAAGAANPTANVNVNGFLSTAAGMGFGPVEALVPIIGGAVAYQGKVVHRIIGTGTINEITGLPANQGTVMVIMPSLLQQVTIADNAVPAAGGRKIRTRSGASVVLANTWEPVGLYDCPVSGALAQVMCC